MRWAVMSTPAPTDEPVITSYAKAPVRMAFLYMPNGVNIHGFWPAETGRNYQSIAYLLEKCSRPQQAC